MLEVISGVAAVGVATAFLLVFYWKINAYDVHNPWQYVSRHSDGEVTEVPATYIPKGAYIRYKALWRARMEGTADYLRAPLWKLEDYWQRNLIERLSDWRWMDVPSSEWPAVWQQ